MTKEQYESALEHRSNGGKGLVPAAKEETPYRYFYHAESECLWAQPASEPIGQDDGSVVELTLAEYNERQDAKAGKELPKAATPAPVAAAQPARRRPAAAATASAAPTGVGLGLAPEPRPAATRQPLHVRARPRTFEEVIGQVSVVQSLSRLIRDSDAPPHLYLFTGPSGCGKTTLGRIVGKHFTSSAPTEIDAAAHGGVDDTREIIEWAQYQSLDGGAKILILDECHALSKAAWQALLKLTEEPPPHLYIVLCTTEDQKVPKTILTRAATYALKPVDAQTLLKYAEALVEQERILLPENSLRYIVSASDGSVRQMLLHLQVCNGAKTLPEVQSLLESSTDRDDVIAIARLILKNPGNYVAIHPLLCEVKKSGAEAEGVRIAIIEYLSAVMLNNPKPQLALVPFLNQLAEPLPQRGGWARMICNLLFACEEDR